jgi:membrane-associated phospholipid phosphatase
MGKNIIDKLCHYNPYILLFTSIIILLLSNDIKLTVYYVFGYILCIIIIKILKHTIKDERPYWNYENSLYNMPSGHCMTVFYSIAFMYMYFQSNISVYNNIIVLYYIVGILMIYNCIEGDYHTVDQTIVGTICGLIFGYYYYIN